MTDERRTHTGHEDLPFAERYRKALSDGQLRRNLLAFQRAWRPSRDAAFAGFASNPARPEIESRPHPRVHVPQTDSAGADEFAAMRDRLAAIKDEVIDHLPEYIDRFQREAESRGVHVYRAANAAAVNRYVLDLCRRHSIQHVVKSKTMVSEETELNAALEAAGITAVETDLGEWIQQLSHERPSHMVMPAIHKSRQQVGELFTEATGRTVSLDDIGEQVQVARRELRQDFLRAGLGISGANALIAETGSVMFISNEGNARLVTTLPSVHVVLAGIEKLVPDYAAAMLQLRLLARSATAQQITSYSTFLAGPPEPGKEMHIILVDNGRNAMRDTPLIRDALRCIRCAACADVCPPYAVVGGHVFGHIYSGAIGLVNTPFHHGIEAATGPQSLCISCNACATVCPVGIPLPAQILDVRARVVRKKGMPLLMRLGLMVWSRPGLARRALRIGSLLTRPYRQGEFIRLPGWIRERSPRIDRLTNWRTPPALAAPSARRLLRKRRPELVTLESPARGTRVAFFIQCLTDHLFPEMATALVRVLEASGMEVVVTEDQHCCGLPALDAGAPKYARKMARRTIETFERINADYIVTGGASCGIAMLHEYQHLFRDDPAWAQRAQALARRVRDFTTFMDEVVRLAPGALAREDSPFESVTYHSFCQSTNVMGLYDAPRRLIRDVAGIAVRELPEGTVCCGFGGSTSATNPEVAREILDRKLENVTATGAGVLVTDNPGCIMHLRGGIDAKGLPVRVMHIAELLAAHLPE
jgi:iron-sulfur cluster protein